MTMIAAGVAGKALGGVSRGPRLAAPGAVMLTAGLVILWWGLGIFRGETGVGMAGSSIVKRVGRGIPGVSKTAPAPTTNVEHVHGGYVEGQGATMPADSIAAVVRRAGFSGRSLMTALAVAKAESGWRPGALGDLGLQDETWGPSVGLFQVRCLKAQTGTGQLRDCDALRDPAFNARSAYVISDGGRNFAAWTQYLNGAYRAFMDDMRGLA